MQSKVLFVCLFLIMRHCVNGLPIETDSTLDRYFINPHIISGVEAPQGFAPYMAAILIGDDFVMVACGGSLLLPNLILTAAHCIDVYQVPGGGLMNTFHGVVGSNNFKTGGTTVQFGGYHIHPEWDPVLMKNDIGMLPLKKKVPLDETTQLVAMNFNHVAGEVASFVTGWGLIATRPSTTPHNLQLLQVNTLNPQSCVDIVREASAIMWPNAPTVDPALEICTLNTNGREIGGLCYGDSGSPLMSNETGTQIAIASWAFTCALGVPDVYARISPYEEFINSIMDLYQ